MKKKKIIKILLSCVFITLVATTVKLSYAAENDEDRGEWLNTNENLTDLKVDNIMKLDTSYNKEGKYVNINWNEPEHYDETGTNHENRYEYRIFVKEEDSNQKWYESIPAKKDVQVLNIYPGDGSNKLKEWMKELSTYEVENSDGTISYKYIKDENGNFIANNRGVVKSDSFGNPAKDEYGNYIYLDDKQPLINVSEVNIDEFNSNPNLKDEKEQYKYDVIYEGAADMNNQKDLSEKAESEIEGFIDSGRGYLCGHDTFGNYSKNRNNLASRMRIAVYTQDENKKYVCNVNCVDKEGYSGCVGDDKIVLNKTGLLTNYPWFIVKKELDVPLSHSNKQFAFGHIWMKYKENSFQPDTDIEIVKDKYGEYGSNNFYLTSWNNTAMIQTGHSLSSNGVTPDEKKILANTLFYLSQVTTNKNAKDYYCVDKKAPNKPDISEVIVDGEAKVKFSKVEDNGSTYSYIVKAHNLKDGSDVRSEGKSQEITSGLRGYLVYTDEEEDTQITNIINNYNNKNLDTNNLNKMGIKVIEGNELENFDGNFNLGTINHNFYVHVAAIDNAGNISETSTKKYEYLNILNVEPEMQSFSKYNIIWTDVTLNNISEDNTAFAIRDVKDIVSQKISVKYDKTKLKYNGACTCDRAFMILSENEDEGVITFNLTCRNINNYLGKADMLALSFDALDSGETELSISNGMMMDINNRQVDVLPVQLGKCNINIE